MLDQMKTWTQNQTQTTSDPASAAERFRVQLRLRDEVLAYGLSAVLTAQPNVESCVVVPPETASEGHRRPDYDDCDVVILCADDGLPDHWPPPGARHRPRALVIVDENHPDSISTFEADGYLLHQNLTRETLGRALGQLASGEVALPVSIARQLLALNSRASPPTPALAFSVRLTARERETLLLLSEGCSNKQIATRLGISVHGAKRLVGNVLLKCAAENRTAAVVTAIRSGLLEPPPVPHATDGYRAT
jgi:two-component system, NarL family, nitrate/nitrite response regulator NarL